MLNAISSTPFAIGSVSSIAPVDGQAYALPAVPYFVILPAADCDVTISTGQRIYDRAGSGIAEGRPKARFYVYGANHNFFNTVWAADWRRLRLTDAAGLHRRRQPAALGRSLAGRFHRAAPVSRERVRRHVARWSDLPVDRGLQDLRVRHETNHVEAAERGARRVSRLRAGQR